MGVRVHMHKRTTPKTFARAKELHCNMTPVEVKLWARLRANRLDGVHFRNQHAIGNYVPDFCAIKERLIIELDGSQHLEQTEYDDDRTKYFESLGYRVIRFWNNQIMKDMNGVIFTITYALEKKA